MGVIIDIVCFVFGEIVELVVVYKIEDVWDLVIMIVMLI